MPMMMKIHQNQNSCKIPQKYIIHQMHACEINLTWDHNHSIECAKVLSLRSIHPDTVKTINSYYDDRHSPSSALHLHQLNLAIQFIGKEGGLEYVRADRFLNPLYGDVFSLYKKWRIKKHDTVVKTIDIFGISSSI